ncbi:MAG: hypothetical protein ACOY35_11860 [Bacillota bacterium]|nr:hypothetical protein [Bacillota bacterium]
MSEEVKFDVIQEFGSAAFSPDFGAWADLNYEENGKEFSRTTMVLVNPAWKEPLEKAGGEYFPPSWAYDPEADMYLLLVKWQNGVRLPIAFRKEEAGKLLFDNYVKIPFDIMISNKKLSGDVEEDEELRMHVIWDAKFSKSPQAAWPE